MVSFPGGDRQLFSPGVKDNVCGDERKISVPLKIRFEKGAVIFNPNTRFELGSFSFEVRKHRRQPETSLPIPAQGSS
ncbi:hypothetical protein [Prosthecochloris sp. GSB1]|uniref:hypothetical protein n=1 Tax=Prosthecochloris sp. GSB1 TaxID=281093 RepID=UPI0030021E5D